MTARHATHAAVVILVSAGVATILARSQTYQMSIPVKREVTVELHYNYSIREYTPRIQVAVLESAARASYESPEAAATSHVSAMIAGDWEWFLGTWTAQFGRSLERDLQAQGIAREAVLRKWEALKNAKVEFSSRIDTGSFAIVTLAVSTGGTLIVPLKVVDRQWRVTNELKDDPALSAGPQLKWGPDGKAVIQKVVR